jgi:hypothetical protein
MIKLLNNLRLPLFFLLIFSNVILLTAAESIDENIQPVNIVDDTHDYISDRINSVVNWFDNFFNDERMLYEDPPTTDIRVKNSFSWKKDRTVLSQAFFHVNIKLPKASKKLRLVISGNNNEDSSDDSLDNATDIKETNRIRLTDLGARYNFVHSRSSKLHLDAGVKAKLPLKFYSKLRYSQLLPISFFQQVRFTEIFSWNKLAGFEGISKLDFAYMFSKSFILQWENEGRYIKLTDSIDWDSEISLEHKFSKKTAISYNIGANGLLKPETSISEYRASIQFRNKLYRDWLLYAIKPGYRWTKNEDNTYSENKAVMLLLELHFGNNYSL